jgi:hypothetical protein|tara:strand:+ start:364 stop:981 length:618 start_codon:yes stop_codon:yes gene_type:complete
MANVPKEVNINYTDMSGKSHGTKTSSGATVFGMDPISLKQFQSDYGYLLENVKAEEFFKVIGMDIPERFMGTSLNDVIANQVGDELLKLFKADMISPIQFEESLISGKGYEGYHSKSVAYGEGAPASADTLFVGPELGSSDIDIVTSALSGLSQLFGAAPDMTNWKNFNNLMDLMYWNLEYPEKEKSGKWDHVLNYEMQEQVPSN